VNKRFPEIVDLVAVTNKHVEYYGYIDDIDYDFRNPRFLVEFFPGQSLWFGLDEITLMEYPEKKKSNV
jgi:hypothetical protein